MITKLGEFTLEDYRKSFMGIKKHTPNADGVYGYSMVQGPKPRWIRHSKEKSEFIDKPPFQPKF